MDYLTADYLTASLILFAIGVILLIAEVLIPTGGFMVVGSLVFFALGVGIILAEGTTTEAVVAISALAVGLPAAGYAIVSAWRRMAIGVVLPDDTTAGPSASPGQGELSQYKNRVGKTVSPLRPSGTAEFDNRRIDAMTEGQMIDAGVWVRCLGVRGGSLIVREIEPPADMTDIAPGLQPSAMPNIELDIAPGVLAPQLTTEPTPIKKPVDDLDDLDLELEK